MDWIERLFNISPDGGDGSLELLVAGAGLAALALIGFRRRMGSLFRRPRSHRAVRRERPLVH
jgi:MYXO-CTERM domain-containing protein